MCIVGVCVGLACLTLALRVWYVRSHRISAEEQFRKMRRHIDESLSSKGFVQTSGGAWQLPRGAATNVTPLSVPVAQQPMAQRIDLMKERLKDKTCRVLFGSGKQWVITTEKGREEVRRWLENYGQLLESPGSPSLWLKHRTLIVAPDGSFASSNRISLGPMDGTANSLYGHVLDDIFETYGEPY